MSSDHWTGMFMISAAGEGSLIAAGLEAVLLGVVTIAADSGVTIEDSGEVAEAAGLEEAEEAEEACPKAAATACWAAVFFPGVGANDPPEEVEE